MRLPWALFPAHQRARLEPLWARLGHGDWALSSLKSSLGRRGQGVGVARGAGDCLLVMVADLGVGGMLRLGAGLRVALVAYFIKIQIIKIKNHQ